MATSFETMVLQNQRLVLAQHTVNQFQPAPALSIAVGSEASAQLLSLCLHTLPICTIIPTIVKTQIQATLQSNSRSAAGPAKPEDAIVDNYIYVLTLML